MTKVKEEIKKILKESIYGLYYDTFNNDDEGIDEVIELILNVVKTNG